MLPVPRTGGILQTVVDGRAAARDGRPLCPRWTDSRPSVPHSTPQLWSGRMGLVVACLPDDAAPYRVVPFGYSWVESADATWSLVSGALWSGIRRKWVGGVTAENPAGSEIIAMSEVTRVIVCEPTGDGQFLGWALVSRR